MARTKQERLEARLSAEENQTIAAAAEASGLSKSAFVIKAALDEANRQLMNQQVTIVAKDHAQAFLQWLDRPAEIIPAMRPLADAPIIQHR